MKQTGYIVSGRNGYYAIDYYYKGMCIRCIESGLTKKMAENLAGLLATAETGWYRRNGRQAWLTANKNGSNKPHYFGKEEL